MGAQGHVTVGDLDLERAHKAANPTRELFKEGDRFLIEGKVWAIDSAGDHTASDGSWYSLSAPEEDDIEILSHEQIAALERV